MNDEALRQVYKQSSSPSFCTHRQPGGVYVGSRQTARWGVYSTRSATRTVYRADDPTTTQLTDKKDDNLFSSLLTNGHHVLKQLLLIRQTINTISEIVVITCV